MFLTRSQLTKNPPDIVERSWGDTPVRNVCTSATVYAFTTAFSWSERAAYTNAACIEWNRFPITSCMLWILGWCTTALPKSICGFHRHRSPFLLLPWAKKIPVSENDIFLWLIWLNKSLDCASLMSDCASAHLAVVSLITCSNLCSLPYLSSQAAQTIAWLICMFSTCLMHVTPWGSFRKISSNLLRSLSRSSVISVEVGMIWIGSEGGSTSQSPLLEVTSEITRNGNWVKQQYIF